MSYNKADKYYSCEESRAIFYYTKIEFYSCQHSKDEEYGLCFRTS